MAIEGVRAYQREDPNNKIAVSNVLSCSKSVVTTVYLITKIYFIGGWVGRGLTSTLCICIVDDYHISKTPVELPTFLFSGNYRSPSFAFQHQHLS